jgi:hypothetical protein
MRGITISRGAPPAANGGRVVLAEDVKLGERRLRKGHRLSPYDMALLATADRPVHAVVLDPEDVHEDDAGLRLATAVAGPGLGIRGPSFSRYNLVAARKGLLRVDADALLRMNLLPGVAIFTLADRLPVVPGKIVTGVKVTPVAVADATVREAAAIAAEIDRLANEGVDLVLAAGGNTIDPLDPTLRALELTGAEIVRFGAPAHPGSMFWLAYRGELPIFNLASCSMFSKATIADVVLPWIMTGERVEPRTLAELGYGGLLDRGMSFRFPPYDVESVEEAGEE